MNNKAAILITGIMGHIGYASAIYLSKYGYKIIGIYNKSIDIKKKKELLRYNIKLIKNNLEHPKTIKKIYN